MTHPVWHGRMILMAGGALFGAIDPDRLAGHAHYERNFRLLQSARGAIMLAALGLSIVAWLLTCLLVFGSKGRTYRRLISRAFTAH